MMASCTISTLTREDMGSPLELSLETLLRAMSVSDDQNIVNLDPPQIRECSRWASGSAGTSCELWCCVR